jgi:rhamnose transport system permease protein
MSLLEKSGTAGVSSFTYADTQRPAWQRVLLTRDAAVIALLVAVTLYSIANIPFFSNDITLYFLLLDLTPILLIALPMTMVIITGEIDLSVASTVALTSVVFGVLHREGVPIPAAAVLALLGAAVCGAFNGILVTRVGLPSLAVTIGTLALYRGIAVGLLGTTAITDWPESWTDLAKNKLGTSMIPVVVIPIVALAVLFAVLLHFTSFGRGVYAIGLSKEAARFSGVNVDRTKLVLFTLSGLVSGLAGIYFTLRYGSARGDNANGMELKVIAAVLLGGVSIFGGRGAIPGVLGGVFLIGVIGSALRLDDYSDNVIQIITGILLIVSVVAPSLLGWMGRTRRRGGARPSPADQNLSEATNPTTVPNGSSK